MKLKSFLFIVSLLFFSCSTPTVDVENILGKGDGNLTIHGGEIGSDNVFVWDKINVLEFTDFYSQIDTVISEKIFTQTVKYLVPENESATVKWDSNGKLLNTNENKVWDGGLQKWVVTNNATFDVTGITTLRVEANVAFQQNNARRLITTPIKINKSISDAFGFTFGTPRTALGEYVTRDLSPKYALAFNEDILINPVDILEFENGLLRKIYSLRNNAYVASFINICNELKIPTKLSYEIGSGGTFKINNPQEWKLGTLKINVYSNSQKNVFGNDVYQSEAEIAFITIEKQ